MKKALLIAFAVATASVTLVAQDVKDATSRSKSPVKVEMKKLDEALDAVADYLAKPEGKAPLAQIATAQQALQQAKQHAPRTAKAKPEGERAAFVIEYKLQINRAARGLLDLEDALLQKNWEVASSTVKQLQQQKKAGHKKFKGKRRRNNADKDGGKNQGKQAAK